MNYGDDPVGLMIRINNILDTGIPKNIQQCEKELASLQADLQSTKEAYGKPFHGADILKEKQERLRQLERELNLDSMDVAKIVQETDVPAPEAPCTSSLEDRILAAQRRSDAQLAGRQTGRQASEPQIQ